MQTQNHTWTRLSPSDFAALGLNQVAYVKPVEDEHGRTVFAVRAANGTDMATLAEHKVAVAAIRQHDMEALSVH